MASVPGRMSDALHSKGIKTPGLEEEGSQVEVLQKPQFPGLPILTVKRVLFHSTPPGKCQPSVPLAKFSFCDHDSLAKHVLEGKSLRDFKFPPV